MVLVHPLVLFRWLVATGELVSLVEQVVLQFQGLELAVGEAMEAELLERGAPMVL
jgi:hypothetical protein